MAFRFLITVLTIFTIVLLSSPASGQITTSCTPSMITSFTPCMNFVTNSSINGTAPTTDCCNSLKSLMSNGKDCLCLITTAGIPFRVPINQNMAISLPRACNMPGVPLQCKATGAPVPAPGPISNGPTPSPNSAPSPSGKGIPKPLSPRLAPEADVSPSPTGNRAGVTPSAAHPSCTVSSIILVAFYGSILALKYYEF